MGFDNLTAGLIVVAVLAAGARIGLSETCLNLKSVGTTVVTAAFLAVATHPLLVERGYSEGTITLAIAGLTFFSRDILDILLVLKNQVREDPLGLLRDYLIHRRDKGQRDD